MSNNPQQLFNPVAPVPAAPAPKRIAKAVGDWVQTIAVVAAWLVVLLAVLAGGFLAIQAIIYVVSLARRALAI